MKLTTQLEMVGREIVRRYGGASIQAVEARAVVDAINEGLDEFEGLLYLAHILDSGSLWLVVGRT
jgi:hypothetical protein